MPRNFLQDGIEAFRVLQGRRSGRTDQFRNENSIPPDRTVRKNASVAPLYFLLYSTVQIFSSLLPQGESDSEAFAAASASVKGRRLSPSRSFAGHQFDLGCVRLERWVIGCRRVLEEGPASSLEVAMTFAPKNRRISASGFRCECDTDSSLKYCSESEREGRPFPFKLAEPARRVSRYLMCSSRSRGKRHKWMAAHLFDNSSSTRSKSSSPSFFAFAFCFFSAFRSFFEALSGRDEVDCMTESIPAFAIVEDSVNLSLS